MTSPAHRGLAVLIRHLHMTDRRRHQFHDHLLNRAPQPLAGDFHAGAGANDAEASLPVPASTPMVFHASNESRTAALNNKDILTMICPKTPLLTTSVIETSMETAQELRHWALLCKDHASKTVSIAQRLNADGTLKLAMVSERFSRLAVVLAGRLDHPQLRSMALHEIAAQHLDPVQSLNVTAAAQHWSCVAQADAIEALIGRMNQERMTHWRFVAWGNAATTQETALLHEAFAWLAGAQTMINALRVEAGMCLAGWNDQAVTTWTWLAALLGQRHRYLSDDGWNDRFLETQWRSNLRDGVQTTLDALNTESSLVAR